MIKYLLNLAVGFCLQLIVILDLLIVTVMISICTMCVIMLKQLRCVCETYPRMAKFTRTNIYTLIPVQRSCHKKYSCAIWQLLSFILLWIMFIFLKICQMSKSKGLLQKGVFMWNMNENSDTHFWKFLSGLVWYKFSKRKPNSNVKATG